MKVYVMNTETNAIVYQNDEVFSVRRHIIYKNGEELKYFEVEERNGYQSLFEIAKHRVFKEVFI